MLSDFKVNNEFDDILSNIKLNNGIDVVLSDSKGKQWI